MSQRCLVSLRKNVSDLDLYYDCIYDENGSLDILLKDWLAMEETGGFYLGPWKLNIRDKEIFPKFMEDFQKIKTYCPKFTSLKDCWAIYIDGVSIHNNEPQWF